MSALKNHRQELFAQGIAAQLSPQDAYINAGFKGEATASQAASRLAKKPHVRARIEELAAARDRVREREQTKAFNRVFRAPLEIRVSERNYRVALLDDVLNRLLTVMDERGADPTMQEIPGGKTGLVVRQFKAAGKELEEEFVIDVGLSAEVRNVMKHVAIELGEWSEKREITGRDGGPVEFAEAKKLTREQIQAARQRLLEAKAILSAPPDPAEHAENDSDS